MTTRRRHWPDKLPEDQRLAWCAWFRAHGIDPEHITLPGYVVVDDDAKRITYRAYDLIDGARYADPTGQQASQSEQVTELDREIVPFPCPVTSP